MDAVTTTNESPELTPELSNQELIRNCDRIESFLLESFVPRNMSELAVELFISIEDAIAASEYGVENGRFVIDNSLAEEFPEFDPEEAWSQCIRLP